LEAGIRGARESANQTPETVFDAHRERKKSLCHRIGSFEIGTHEENVEKED